MVVRVGFEQTAYLVGEVDGFQLVCIDVLSGELDGREIELDYSTTSGSASKFHDCSHIKYCRCIYFSCNKQILYSFLNVQSANIINYSNVQRHVFMTFHDNFDRFLRP